MASNPYDVKVGQVWQSCDWRDALLYKRVVDIDGDKAVVEQVHEHRDGFTNWFGTHIGRRTRIRLDRFKPGSTGYRLVRDVANRVVAERAENERLRRPVSDEEVREAMDAVESLYRAAELAFIGGKTSLRVMKLYRDTIEAVLTRAARRPAEVVEAWDRFSSDAPPDMVDRDRAVIDRFFHGDDAS